ncbi:MAG: alpha/beta hydrolase [Asticcacaulis sp.]
MIRTLLTGVMAAGLLLTAPAMAETISPTGPTKRLYDGPAPGSESWTRPEVAQTHARGVGLSYTNVRDPELTPYLPEAGKANGAAAIILPGGGLRGLSVGQDTEDMIRLLNDKGVAVFVLKYRTLQREVEAPRPPAPAGAAPAPFPNMPIGPLANANPAPDDAGLTEVLRLAGDDARLALKMVRADASALGIDPKRVGFIGTSAGGGVAMNVILDPQGEMPDFFVSIFGPSLQDVVVPDNAPPLFIATETPHGQVTNGLLALYLLWKNAGKSAELHAYNVPNFTMPVSLYGPRMIEFLESSHLFKPATAPAQ